MRWGAQLEHAGIIRQLISNSGFRVVCAKHSHHERAAARLCESDRN